MATERGLGKCAQGHIGSYGYASRPDQNYPFCPQCGMPMVWACPACDSRMPDDADELAVARFCRHCGAPYFGDEPAAVEPARAADGQAKENGRRKKGAT
jgi:hypothetical protein